MSTTEVGGAALKGGILCGADLPGGAVGSFRAETGGFVTTVGASSSCGIGVSPIPGGGGEGFRPASGLSMPVFGRFCRAPVVGTREDVGGNFGMGGGPVVAETSVVLFGAAGNTKPHVGH